MKPGMYSRAIFDLAPLSDIQNLHQFYVQIDEASSLPVTSKMWDRLVFLTISYFLTICIQK